MAHTAARQPNADIILKAAKQASLSMAVDDSYGLWELLWELQTDFPETEPAVLKDVARGALRELIRKGLIALTEGSVGSPQRSLDREQALAGLDRPENWQAPEKSGDVEMRFAATEAGQQAYFGSARAG